MSVVHYLARILAPWQSTFSSSKALSTSVTTVHMLALFFGGGLAVAADRSTLRLYRADAADRIQQLRELRAVHRPVLVALSFLFASGAALVAADVEAFATSPVFWVKMGLVTLLLANGAVLTRTEWRLRQTTLPNDSEAVATVSLWRRLRWSAVASVAFWIATLIVGVVPTNTQSPRSESQTRPQRTFAADKQCPSRHSCPVTRRPEVVPASAVTSAAPV